MATNDTLREGILAVDGIHVYLFETVGRLIGTEAFAPLYRSATTWLGGRLVFLLACLCFARACYQALSPFYGIYYRVVTHFFTSSVTIFDDDALFKTTMTWLSANPQVANSRNLLAYTRARGSVGVDSIPDEDPDQPGFAYKEVKLPPIYLPALGTYTVVSWGGHWFMFCHLENKSRCYMTDRKSELVIWCFSHSTEPIKQLVAHAKEVSDRGKDSKTAVFRPRFSVLLGHEREPSLSHWMQVVERPIRQMRTVVLDKGNKKRLCDDIKEYLSPVTAKWYANRGIALRRGYMFYGPPGTGKTSLVYAVAGLFGLNIYVASLQEPLMNESNLSLLLNSLPRYCLILLEDIDAVGTARPTEVSAQAAQSGQKMGNNGGGIFDNMTLSGLLNVLDGVASQEGRIMIMTTNRINALDKALIRPGRVDYQVPFKNATKKQAGKMFARVYDESRTQSLADESDSDNEDYAAAAGRRKETTAGSGGAAAAAAAAAASVADRELDIPAGELREKMKQFREKVPEGEFTPAEIQGFLLQRKWQPGRAAREADEWVAALRRQKASQSNILDVQ